MSLSRIEVQNPDLILQQADQDQGTVARFAHVNHVIDYLNGAKGAGSYKSYVALVSQSGTDAPTVKVLNNTLGVVTPTYNSSGLYYFTSDGLFTTNKTFLISQNVIDLATSAGYDLSYISSNTVQLETGVIGVGASNIGITDLPIEIRVYN